MGNLSGLAAIAQLGGAAASAGNAYSQYGAQLGQAKYQAGALNQNAAFADMQAAQAIKVGEFAAAQRGAQAAQEIGKYRVSTGNVDVNTGTAAKVQEDIASAAAVDRTNILANASLNRWGYGIQAADYRGQARMAKIGGRFAANSALAAGASEVGRAGIGAAYYGSQAGWFSPDYTGVGNNMTRVARL